MIGDNQDERVERADATTVLPPGQRQRLELLLAAVGPIRISTAERASLEWLAGQEDITVTNLAALIHRARGAHDSGGGSR